MDMSYRQFLIGITTVIPSVAVFAEEITPEGALELMEECQKQREENIAPLRDQAIEDCVAKKGRDREYCESFNRTFGNARPRAGGGSGFSPPPARFSRLISLSPNYGLRGILVGCLTKGRIYPMKATSLAARYFTACLFIVVANSAKFFCQHPNWCVQLYRPKHGPAGSPRHSPKGRGQ